MKTLLYTPSVIAAVFVCLLCTGCSEKNKFGKFTEEQMQQIPLANKYDLPAPSGDSMVLAVFSDTITSDEILDTIEKVAKPAAEKLDGETFTSQARPFFREAIKGKVTDILLYQEARKTAPENIDDSLDKAVEAEVSRFVSGYGNNYALAESKIKDMGYDWRTFREYQKKLIMTQSFLSSKLKEERRYSHQQIQDYYRQHQSDFCWDGTVSFSIVEIQPQELTAEDVHDGETPETAAKRIASETLIHLRDGDDFAETAKRYHGPLAAIGGKVETVTIGKNSLAEPYNSLETYAVQMQPGQTSHPILLEGHLFILRVNALKQSGCESFEEVQNRIRQMLIFEYRQQQYQQLVDQLVMKADLVQMEHFTDFCVQQAYDRWNGKSKQVSVSRNQESATSYQ